MADTVLTHHIAVVNWESGWIGEGEIMAINA